MSPAAGHSGWEDHAQASAFHYSHHRYFECNYAGSQSAWLDVLFGTFKPCFSKQDAEDGAKVRDDAKASLRTPPTPSFVAYLALACCCVGVWATQACAAAAPGAPALAPPRAAALAALAALGPLALCVLFGGSQGGVPLLAQGLGAAVVHLVLGAVFTILPVFLVCYWAALPAPAGV